MTATNRTADPIALPVIGARGFKILWYLTMLLGLFVFLLALPGYVSMLPEGPHVGGLIATPTNLDIGLHMLNDLISISTVLLAMVLSWLLFRQRSSDRMVAYVSIYLIVYAFGFAGPLEIVQNQWLNPDINLYNLTTASIFGPMSIALIVLFPDGHFVPPWTKWLVLASFGLVHLSLNYSDLITRQGATPYFWVAVFFLLALFLVGFGVQVHRYRRISNQTEKQQIKWMVYGLGLWLLLLVVSSVPYFRLQLLPAGSPLPWWASIGSLIWSISLAVLPLSLTISVLRFRLYDIDIIINRTLVYSVLTVLIILLYVLVVATLGSIFQTTLNSLIALITTTLIALIFNPLRVRLQLAANRLMFGQRDEPFEVVRRLGHRLESSADPSSILPAIVETVTETLKMPYAEITLLFGEHDYSAAVEGKPLGEEIQFPLSYQNEIIGYLGVSQRASGEALSEADLGLLRQIARQAGPAVQAVRLTQDLQASRKRLVTAREEERRRLRRNLHDGLGPVLASQGLKMAAASKLIRDNPKRAKQLLDELAAHNESTVAEIRRLVYDLRPAALDQLGLFGAISEYASEFGELSIQVNQPDIGLPELPAAIEVAAYRVATEAITNVSRHAKATKCSVSIAIEEENRQEMLCLNIDDNGIGLAPNHRPGIGLTSMRERAEEIGGSFGIESDGKKGTKIRARLPIAH